MHIEILDLIEGARQARRLANAKDADELIPGDILAVIYYRQHAQWGQLVKLVPGVAVEAGGWTVPWPAG